MNRNRTIVPSISFENLESRRLLSGSGLTGLISQVSADFSEIKERLEASLQSATQQKQSAEADAQNMRRIIDDLRYNSELLGTSKEALAAAIRVAGSDDPGATDKAKRLLVVDGLGLPREALDSGLNAKALIEHVADLNLLGGGDKQSDRGYWNDLVRNGAERALAGVVVEQFGIPDAAAQGKTAKELLDGAGNIQLVGGDAQSPAAWQGLELFKAGQITLEQFVDDFTHANDVNPNNPEPAPAQPTPVHENPSEEPPAEPVITATISDIHDNGDGSGSYTATIHYPDGASETRHVTVNVDGSSTIRFADGRVENHPPGSTQVPPSSAEGQTVVVSQDTDGDGNNDSGTLGGDDDDDEDDNDNSSDNSNDAAAADDTSADDGAGDDSGAGGEAGTPNPDASDFDPRKAAEFYFNTPIGRSLAGNLIDPVKSQRGGGAIDPMEEAVNFAGAAEFYARFGGAPALKTVGGDIDYPDDAGSHFVIIDARQLEAIRIASGGAVGGPDIGKGPAAPEQPEKSPVAGPAPASPGGTQSAFSQVAIVAPATSITAKASIKLTTSLRK